MLLASAPFVGTARVARVNDRVTTTTQPRHSHPPARSFRPQPQRNQKRVICERPFVRTACAPLFTLLQEQQQGESAQQPLARKEKRPPKALSGYDVATEVVLSSGGGSVNGIELLSVVKDELLKKRGRVCYYLPRDTQHTTITDAFGGTWIDHVLNGKSKSGSLIV